MTYAGQGAAYAVSELLLPTASTQGKLTVDVTNQGSSAWPAGGGYTFDPAGQDFHPAYGVLYGTMPMTVQNVPPTMVYEQPGMGGSVGSITPTLYAEGVDPDNWPGGALKYSFKICSGAAAAPAACAQYGWTVRPGRHRPEPWPGARPTTGGCRRTTTTPASTTAPI